jgi:hypothetical protein
VEDSTDSALNEVISCLKATSTEGDALLGAINGTAIYVANHLLAQQALLLPQASTIFLQLYDVAPTDHIETNEGTIKYSSRWLLTQLILKLGVHINYKCVHKKFGIILYRKNGDLLKSLSWALGTKTSKSKTNLSLYSAVNNNDHQALYEASGLVNKMLHDEVKKARIAKQEIECNPTGLKIDSIIKNVDAKLWDFIKNRTESIRHKQNPNIDESPHVANVKKVRRFFILCLLQYCCNIEEP